MAEAGALRCGTSSWGEKSWVGPFYPPGTRPGDFLAHYATRFDAVEADNTYYAAPARELVQGWDRKTPPGFVMCAKLPRSVVHGGEGPRPDPSRVLVRADGDETAQLLERLAELGPKRGPLLLQFPFFSRAVFPRRAPFLERLARFLDELPRGVRCAVEVRNAEWIDGELAALLRARGAALVLSDVARLPPPERIAAALDVVTADFAYCRLIGDRRAVEARTRTFDRLVLDRSGRVARMAELVRELLQRVPEVYAFANNHYAGHGPATIRELARLVRGEAPGEPEATARGGDATS